MWNRDEEASTERYGDELTTMETTDEERPATVGYATTTKGSQPSERATGVLANGEVAYDLENDEVVNEEPSERASGVLTTEEVAFDLEEPWLGTEEPSERAIGALTTEEVAIDLENDYLRMEKPSERAIGALTTEEVAIDLENDYLRMEKLSGDATGEIITGSDDEATRKTTVNICNGARCRCLEALPVVKKRVNFLPSKNVEGEESVAPAEKKTNCEESDSSAAGFGVPLPQSSECNRDADPSVLARVSVAPEDGQEDVEPTEESSGAQDEPAASTDAAPPPEEPPPPHARLFTEEELGALDARTPSTEETRTDPGPTGPAEPEDASGGDASIMNEVVPSIVPPARIAVTLVDERRVIANIGVPRAKLERKDEDVPCPLPFRLRTLVRSVVCLLILNEEAKHGTRCPRCHYPEAYPPEPEPRGHFVPGPFSAGHLARARELVIERAGVLGDSVMEAVLHEISRTYLESASATIAKRLERRRTYWCDRPVREPIQLGGYGSTARL
ncbi:hypothetical protein PF005_g10848 [Phytophthora fragariae]|uniref:Uncharacterized protein n=1 Tax=Phytophthora fragariae TaxID=53985 RepID=A0A6A3Y4A4_9STRA|nr:hypothetical protein PF005_g10848 [Phytophthora fragariae]